MILVDTSVLIDYFRGIENEKVDQFQLVMERGLPFGITLLIYQEVLQGSKTKKDFLLLKKYLDTQNVYGPKNGKESYAEAAKMYLELRFRGVTVRSTIDCFIAQVAMENDLYLLHKDNDFKKIGRHFPLKLWEI